MSNAIKLENVREMRFCRLLFLGKMTVEYSNALSTATLGAIMSMLFKWKGSVYKLIWKEFLLFIVLFYSFQALYRVLSVDMKAYFLDAVEYCQRFGSTIPVTLFLGFYVSRVVSRFFYQFDALPWIVKLPVFVKDEIEGSDEGTRKVKRTLVRYCNLSYCLVLMTISSAGKKRFPTLNHLRVAGLLMDDEQMMMEKTRSIYRQYFVPIVWACNLLERAKREGKVKDEFTYQNLIKEIINLSDDIMNLILTDFVQVPLVYTQSVTICVYTYFISCLFSRQDIEGRTLNVELAFPVYTFLQFFFYIGWLKVAEEMLNPYGEDEDDLDINMVIDYDLKVSYLLADEMQENPALEKDIHWDNVIIDIPYTVATGFKRNVKHPGSPLDVMIPKRLDMIVVESLALVFENDDNVRTQMMKFKEFSMAAASKPSKKTKRLSYPYQMAS